MSYQVFARKYRPRTFRDVLGQDHVVRTLCNAIEQKRLAHAYLFVGPRGTGKTSTARIFAKALNCTGGPKVDFDPDEDVCLEIAEGRSLDVLEIDGASNRGIDNIRDLRDNVQFAPTRGHYRIIYIDEVHMLTKESFNALLKTLEEPPAHVMFIFATTEPHKILPTILSRCQRFDLRPIPGPIIAHHLVNIAAKEGVTLSEEAAFAIARVADGGMRDAQSMLDQLVSFCGNSINEQNVNDIFGVTGRETVAKALAYLLDRQLPSLLHLVHELAEAGRDMGQLLSELMGAVRELLVAKVAPQESRASMPEPWRTTLEQLMQRTPADKIIRLMEVLSSAEEQMRWSSNKRLHLEMGLIRGVHSLAEANISDIIRALNGAPLPETPIATTVLPEVTMPSAAPAASPSPVLPVASPAPAPVVTPAPDVVRGPEPVSRPEPAPAPVPAPPPAEPEAAEAQPAAPPAFAPVSGGEAFSAEAWKKIVDLATRQHPMSVGLLGNTLFLSAEGNLLTIAVHPEDTLSRDQLYDAETLGYLDEAAEEICGSAIRVNVVTDASVPPPPPPQPEPTPDPEPPPAPAPKAVAVPRSPQPSVAEEEAAPSAHRLSEEEFYSDPLIENALRIFHAKIVKQ